MENPIIKALREAKTIDERREIMLKLTKDEKQALFSELYFESGTNLGISFYNGYTRKGLEATRVGSPEYTIAYAFIKKYNVRKVLEVGCAAGKFVKVLRRLGIEAFGVDLSSYVISKANVDVRTFLYNVDVEAEKLPFDNEFFDMIVAIETMEHFANITYALENLKQVLKVGGLMFITVPKPRPWAGRDITHVNLWTKDKWIEYFSNNGFSSLLLNLNYCEILKAHAELLTTLDFGGDIKQRLMKFLREFRWLGKTSLYAYLLVRRRLRGALQSLMNHSHVFLLAREI